MKSTISDPEGFVVHAPDVDHAACGRGVAVLSWPPPKMDHLLSPQGAASNLPLVTPVDLTDPPPGRAAVARGLRPLRNPNRSGSP
jgi:hypothetical protein